MQKGIYSNGLHYIGMSMLPRRRCRGPQRDTHPQFLFKTSDLASTAPTTKPFQVSKTTAGVRLHFPPLVCSNDNPGVRRRRIFWWPDLRVYTNTFWQEKVTLAGEKILKIGKTMSAGLMQPCCLPLSLLPQVSTARIPLTLPHTPHHPTKHPAWKHGQVWSINGGKRK